MSLDMQTDPLGILEVGLDDPLGLKEDPVPFQIGTPQKRIAFSTPSQAETEAIAGVSSAGVSSEPSLRPQTWWERLVTTLPQNLSYELTGERGLEDKPLGPFTQLMEGMATGGALPTRTPEDETFFSNLADAVARQVNPVNTALLGFGIPGLHAALRLPVGTPARSAADAIRGYFMYEGMKGVHDIAQQTATEAGTRSGMGLPTTPAYGRGVGELPIPALMTLGGVLEAPSKGPGEGIRPSEVRPNITHKDMLESGGAARPITRLTTEAPVPVAERKLIDLSQQIADLKAMLERQQIIPAYQAQGEAKQGGQVSFAAEGRVGAIPSARQAATTEQPFPSEQGAAMRGAFVPVAEKAGGLQRSVPIKKALVYPRYTSQDKAEYNRLDQLRQQFPEDKIVDAEGNLSLEYRTIWQQMEDIKNRYGGQTPENERANGPAPLPQQEIQHASTKPSAEGVLEQEIRPRVGEETPLRQPRTTSTEEGVQPTGVASDVAKTHAEAALVQKGGEQYAKEKETQEGLGQQAVGTVATIDAAKKKVGAGVLKNRADMVAKFLPVMHYGRDFRAVAMDIAARLTNEGKWSTKEAKRLAEEEGLKYKHEPRGMHVSQGGRAEAGAFIPFHEMLVSEESIAKVLGFARKAKVAGQQLFNRIRNITSPAEMDLLKGAGLEGFLKQSRTPEEMAEWLKGRKFVEVRKFGEGAQSDKMRELRRLQHEVYDQLNTANRLGIDRIIDGTVPIETAIEGARRQGISEAYLRDLRRMIELAQEASRDINVFDPVGSQPENVAHWEQYTPTKLENYTELAVVKPQTLKGGYKLVDERGNQFGPYTFENHEEAVVQKEQLEAGDPKLKLRTAYNDLGSALPIFPSSHSFPPNTLAFTRVGEAKLSSGEKVLVVAEVQSDWAQRVREETKRPEPGYNTADDPLLQHYERLALKAAIEHARETGLKKVFVQDAESVMLMEGHDRTVTREVYEHDPTEQPEQAKGMRLHYDTILPRIMEELTGEKGQRVSLGEHKMALEGGQVRTDLIFRNPDGTPKTDVSGLVYDVSKARKEFTLTGSDKPIDAPMQRGMHIEPTGRKGEAGAVTLEPIKEAVDATWNAVRWYSEPLVQRLGRLGGPVSKKVTEEAQQIISRAKGFYGSVSRTLDEAKKAVGRPWQGAGTTWVRSLHQYTDRAAANMMFASNERVVPVSETAKPMMAKLDAANRVIGGMARIANPGFLPTGKYQRMLTSYGIDVIRRGHGLAWEAFAEGIAAANKSDPMKVKAFLRRWKATLDEPGSDVARLDKINQDFIRLYPKTISHIKPGSVWHEILVSDPFSYTEVAAQRTAHAAAFREVYKPGTGLFESTRKTVAAELGTHRYGKEFDSLMRALQGHPTDSYTAWWNAPDTAIGGAGRMATTMAMAPLKTLMLSANAIVNIGETVVGGPAIFLGYRNVLPGLAKLPFGLYEQLEMNGAVNRALQNWALDPTSPVRSLIRIGSNVVRTGTWQQMMNEVQEATAAAAAHAVAERIRAGKLTEHQKNRIVAAMRVMGMTTESARKAVGGDTVLLNQFERMAAARLTAGNVALAERSRMGTSRLLNELFWFHSYPQMTVNQLRAVTENLLSDVRTRNWSQAGHNTALIGRLLGGRVVQGALTIGLLSLVSDAIFGVGVKKQEAQDDLGKFVFDAWIAAQGGPVYIAMRTIEAQGDSRLLQQSLASTMTPLAVGSELIDAGLGNGRYQGLPVTERLGEFVASKTPGFRLVKTGMALAGLSNEDKELDTSLRAFYRWRRRTLGFTQNIAVGEAFEDNVAFRAAMRKAVEAIKRGEDWRKELVGQKVGSVFRSFNHKVLVAPDGKELTDEQIEALRRHIGDKPVDKIIAYERLRRQVAYEVLGQKAPKEEKLKKQTRRQQQTIQAPAGQ